MRWQDYEDWDDVPNPWWRSILDYLSVSRWRRRPRTRLFNGYLQVFDYRNMRWKYVHRINAEAKIGGPIPEGHEVHHINGDKRDNRPENLAVLPIEVHRALHDTAAEAAENGRSYTAALVDAFATLGIVQPGIPGSKPTSSTAGCERSHSDGLDRQPESDHVGSHDLKPASGAPSPLLGQQAGSSVARLVRAMMAGRFSGHDRCPKCGGTGYLPEYRHICGGVCFKCGGSGRC